MEGVGKASRRGIVLVRVLMIRTADSGVRSWEIHISTKASTGIDFHSKSPHPPLTLSFSLHFDLYEWDPQASSTLRFLLLPFNYCIYNSLKGERSKYIDPSLLPRSFV